MERVRGPRPCGGRGVRRRVRSKEEDNSSSLRRRRPSSRSPVPPSSRRRLGRGGNGGRRRRRTDEGGGGRGDGGVGVCSGEGMEVSEVVVVVGRGGHRRKGRESSSFVFPAGAAGTAGSEASSPVGAMRRKEGDDRRGAGAKGSGWGGRGGGGISPLIPSPRLRFPRARRAAWIESGRGFARRFANATRFSIEKCTRQRGDLKKNRAGKTDGGGIESHVHCGLRFCCLRPRVHEGWTILNLSTYALLIKDILHHQM